MHHVAPPGRVAAGIVDPQVDRDVLQIPHGKPRCVLKALRQNCITGITGPLWDQQGDGYGFRCIDARTATTNAGRFTGGEKQRRSDGQGGKGALAGGLEKGEHLNELSLMRCPGDATRTGRDNKRPERRVQR